MYVSLLEAVVERVGNKYLFKYLWNEANVGGSITDKPNLYTKGIW
jgi:hypothetical protein